MISTGQKAVVKLSSPITKAMLLKAEREQTRRSDRPKVLPLDQINVADKVFQWRTAGDNLLEDQNHTLGLARVLRELKTPFDPILLTPVGDRFYVVDGHHRLDAYTMAEWSDHIPVEYFDGPLSDAWFLAFDLNKKNRLPMTNGDKLEAAWTMLKEGGMNQTAISEKTIVSRRTVTTMAKTLKEHGKEAEKLSWLSAKRLRMPGESSEFDYDSWAGVEAERLSKTLLHNMGPDTYKRPDVIAKAFMLISENLAEGLCAALTEALEEGSGSAIPF